MAHAAKLASPGRGRRKNSDSPYVIDLHEDISYYYATEGSGLNFPAEEFGTDTERRHADIPKYSRAKVKIVFAVAFPGSKTVDPERALSVARLYKHDPTIVVSTLKSANALIFEHLKIYYALLKKYHERLIHVQTADDLRSVFSGPKTGFLLLVEGADPIEDVGDLEVFYRLGVRSIGLTWNYDNRYAASCMSKKDYGLTGDGERLVEKANELGMIVDLSHSSRQSAIDTLRMSKMPVIIGHANTRAVMDHPRNVDDETLGLLQKNGGAIGFTLIPSTIGRKPSAEALADHVMHVYERFGPNMLAIGTDFFGIQGMSEPEGLEDITKMPNLWKVLRARGLSEDGIARIAYKNAMRVIDKNATIWKRK
jgi:membrane dipeptidase